MDPFCCLCFMSYCLACSLQLTSSSLVCNDFVCAVTFSYGVLGHVWYLNVWYGPTVAQLSCFFSSDSLYGKSHFLFHHSPLID